jgi:hypothetical protein
MGTRGSIGTIVPSPSGKSTLTDIEVAERLGVSRFTVRSWRLKGVGPRFMKMGRAYATGLKTWTNTNGRLSSRRRLSPITPDVICLREDPLARQPESRLLTFLTGERTMALWKLGDGIGRTSRSTACSCGALCARRVHGSRLRTGRKRRGLEKE